MKLLVSVRDAEEAAAALEGGADIIDAKEPAHGALGAVSLAALVEIVSTIGGRRPLSAALGDVSDELTIERSVIDYASVGRVLSHGPGSSPGILFAKIGFAGITDESRAEALTAAAVRAAHIASQGRTGIVATAYADADRMGGLWPDVIIGVAARAGAVGVLLDTADKDGPGLRELIGPASLAAWVNAAHSAGLLVALAGKLTADDLMFVRDAGADIAGVRGAACDQGRAGRIVPGKVSLLRDRALTPLVRR
jgi:uncharacterized protein (UPF0264 family)